jgi:integrase/recombinase XerD
LGFIPKDWEEREVPIPDRLLNSLRHHKAAASATHALVFATSNAGLFTTFYANAKASPGVPVWIVVCATQEKGTAPKDHIVKAGFLHKFRATFATMHLRAGVDLTTVQTWMGHKDLESTMRYLKPARDKEALQKVNATFLCHDLHPSLRMRTLRQLFGSRASSAEANPRSRVGQNGWAHQLWSEESHLVPQGDR